MRLCFKQFVTIVITLAAPVGLLLMLAFPAKAAEPLAAAEAKVEIATVIIGPSQGGITDRAYVLAPPHYGYAVSRAPGNFLDCGEGDDVRRTDADGRDAPGLYCTVTLSETLKTPAAGSRARLIVHF